MAWLPQVLRLIFASHFFSQNGMHDKASRSQILLKKVECILIFHGREAEKGFSADNLARRLSTLLFYFDWKLLDQYLFL
jgi:site-specific recombinase XerC